MKRKLLQKNIKTICCLCLAGTVFVGCSDKSAQKEWSSTELEKLQELGKIVVCNREEESGTRSVFYQEMNFEEDAYEGDVVLNSNDDMIEYIGENENTIGYVSKGMIENDSKIVPVSGEIERELLLVYKGELSDVEKDFLTYIKREGQTIVANHYEPVKKATSFLSDKSKGNIKIGGSSSMSKLLVELADEYMKLNTNANISIVTTDSTEGIHGALSGAYDLGISSRELTDYEKELLTQEAIAKDSITVIVNSNNPVKHLDKEQIKKIFKKEIVDWENIPNE